MGPGRESLGGAVRHRPAVQRPRLARVRPPTRLPVGWQRCGASCSDISGATSGTYTPVVADVGNAQDVTVAASNSAGSSSATSDQTATVSSGDGTGAIEGPANTAMPPVTGVADTGPLSRRSFLRRPVHGSVARPGTSISREIAIRRVAIASMRSAPPMVRGLAAANASTRTPRTGAHTILSPTRQLPHVPMLQEERGRARSG